MKISQISITPLRLPLRQPYVWSQGIEDAFEVNLVECVGEDGTIGYGETTTAPDALAQKRILERLAKYFIGRDTAEVEAARDAAYRGSFLAFGANMPRFANQMFCGIEMAVLDLQGKALGLPVWDLLGGQRRSDVGYFYFLQGANPAELAADAAQAVAMGEPVIYLKVGLGLDKDLEAVSAVRQAIGSTRFRLDANEAWDPAEALSTIRLLEAFNIEYIEQPTGSASLDALGHVTQRSPIPIGADQSVFTLNEVYRACAQGHADMIAVGPREIGGLRPMMKAAAVAEAAGMKICIHSSMTTGITTCAEHHVGRAIGNLDDGNQIMWQLLAEDIVASPHLVPKRGRLALDGNPGLGFELDKDAVAAAAERFAAYHSDD